MSKQELIELGKKINNNYRLIVGMGAFIYGCFIFYHQQAINTQEISKLKYEVEEIKKTTIATERRVDIVLAEIKRDLSSISTDLQDIKKQLFIEGLKHGK